MTQKKAFKKFVIEFVLFTDDDLLTASNETGIDATENENFLPPTVGGVG